MFYYFYSKIELKSIDSISLKKYNNINAQIYFEGEH